MSLSPVADARMTVPAGNPMGAAPVDGAARNHLLLSGLTKSFGDFQALAGVDLAIRSGELVTLLGPSGCGKTTLLRTIAGFLRQDTGTITLNNRPIDDLPAHRRDFGMVFQSYAVFPHMSVADNVGYGLRARAVPAAERAVRVARALDRVQLGPLAHRFPGELSGGQKQRVGLARALVIEPALLLMDEPLSNLDAKLRIDMRQEIRLMQRELGITTLYVTHDQEEAMAISDRVAIMDQGRLQQLGAPEAIYGDPVNAFVADFIGGCNWLDAHLAGTTDDPAVLIAGEPPFALGRPLRAPATAGQALRVGLRADQLVPGADAVPGLTGRVLVRSYLGARTRLRLRHAGTGVLIDADLSSAPGLPGEGADVRLGFSGASALVFTAEGRRLA
jgi:iron(III) transport system ATP-binding protein